MPNTEMKCYSIKKAILTLKCTECGFTEEVKFSDYFGPMGLCDECENSENYMEPTNILVKKGEECQI